MTDLDTSIQRTCSAECLYRQLDVDGQFTNKNMYPRNTSTKHHGGKYVRVNSSSERPPQCTMGTGTRWQPPSVYIRSASGRIANRRANGYTYVLGWFLVGSQQGKGQGRTPFSTKPTRYTCLSVVEKQGEWSEWCVVVMRWADVKPTTWMNAINIRHAWE